MFAILVCCLKFRWDCFRIGRDVFRGLLEMIHALTGLNWSRFGPDLGLQ